ncbi:MAG: DNA-binding protein WhiA [Oscillospiraceae bacterium]|nr:DNA-binding protein WhiA [Oscillospiraceae bacterium]
MSFSSAIKDELCRVEAPGECCARAELASVYMINSAAGAPPDCLVTENAAFARRAFNLLRSLHSAPPEIIVQRNRKLKKNATYTVRVGAEPGLAAIVGGHGAAAAAVGAGTGTGAKSVDRLKRIIRKKCCKRAALRGAFLAGGSVTDPEKLYHLEIYCKKHELAKYFSGLMAEYGLNPKITERTDYCVVYVKDSGRIVDFLNLTGAHRALMSLENIRIIKEMRNGVNRAVNCETANLEKTVNASLKHITNILYIQSTDGLNALPKGLREIAEIRAAHRDISLVELGQMLDPPLGKSGVNHRLRKLDAIAEEIRARSNTQSAPAPSIPPTPVIEKLNNISNKI